MPDPEKPPPNHSFFRDYAEIEVALHTFVRSIVPTREDAAEVMQQVMIALWEGHGQAAEFRPWAFGVARNQAHMHLRNMSRDRHVFDDELVGRLADFAVREESRLDKEREALDGCLQKLADEHRELVLKAYDKGARIDELARQRGKTPMSLYKLLHRIRQSLLDCVLRTLAREDFA